MCCFPPAEQSVYRIAVRKRGKNSCEVQHCSLCRSATCRCCACSFAAHHLFFDRAALSSHIIIQTLLAVPSLSSLSLSESCAVAVLIFGVLVVWGFVFLWQGRQGGCGVGEGRGSGSGRFIQEYVMWLKSTSEGP